jgi:hypothetical protein
VVARGGWVESEHDAVIASVLKIKSSACSDQQASSD